MKMRWLALLPLFLVACDSDDDGLTNSEEKDLGTDPKVADSDGDGLNDGAEVNNHDTDPLDADTDADGMEDGHEIDVGADPLVEDTDGDGFLDGDETDIGCVNPFDWPDDQGMFPDFSYLADSTEGTGWDYDDIMPDFDGVDQYGNDFNLYQYYGYVIILDLSAGWCGPCKTVASRAEGHYQDHRLDGFTVIHAMVDDYSYGGGFSDTFLAEWAEDYELTFPVINDPEDAASSGLGGSGVYEGYIPFMVLLDRDMRIDSGYTGATADGQAVARAMELIGE